jgi:hypothetical protein
MRTIAGGSHKVDFRTHRTPGGLFLPGKLCAPPLEAKSWTHASSRGSAESSVELQ